MCSSNLSRSFQACQVISSTSCCWASCQFLQWLHTTKILSAKIFGRLPCWLSGNPCFTSGNFLTTSFKLPTRSLYLNCRLCSLCARLSPRKPNLPSQALTQLAALANPCTSPRQKQHCYPWLSHILRGCQSSVGCPLLGLCFFWALPFLTWLHLQVATSIDCFQYVMQQGCPAQKCFETVWKQGCPAQVCFKLTLCVNRAVQPKFALNWNCVKTGLSSPSFSHYKNQ